MRKDMRIEKIIYTCDACGNRYEPEDFDKILERLPKKMTITYSSPGIISCEPNYSSDLCPRCAKKLNDFLKTFSSILF